MLARLIGLAGPRLVLGFLQSLVDGMMARAEAEDRAADKLRAAAGKLYDESVGAEARADEARKLGRKIASLRLV